MLLLTRIKKVMLIIKTIIMYDPTKKPTRNGTQI